MKEKLKKLLFGKPNNMIILIANVVINISWVFFLGYFINESIEKTLIIIIIWSLSLFMGKAKHYKSPLKCFLMQLFLFASIFMSIHINIYIAVLFTIYSKYLFSSWADIDNDDEAEIDDKPNIQDLTLWKSSNEESVHQKLIDYLKYNAITDEYLKAEELLKERVDTTTFLVYKRRFIDQCSYEKIAEEFDMPNPRIKECLDKCYYYLIGRLNI